MMRFVVYGVYHVAEGLPDSDEVRTYRTLAEAEACKDEWEQDEDFRSVYVEEEDVETWL